MVKNSPTNAEDTGDARKIPWRRKWQPTAVFMSGKSHEQEPVGLQSMGLQSGTQLTDLAHSVYVNPKLLIYLCLPTCSTISFDNHSLFSISSNYLLLMFLLSDICGFSPEKILIMRNTIISIIPRILLRIY